MTRKICVTVFISAGLLAIFVSVLTAQACRHHHYRPRFEAAKNNSDCITGNDGKVTCLIGVYPKGRQRLPSRPHLRESAMANTHIFSWKNISATPTPIKLGNGFYGLTVHAGTWGGGRVTLQRLAADGSTYATAFKAFSADSSATAYVPSGTYQLTLDTATDVSADLVLTEPH